MIRNHNKPVGFWHGDYVPRSPTIEDPLNSLQTDTARAVFLDVLCDVAARQVEDLRSQLCQEHVEALARHKWYSTSFTPREQLLAAPDFWTWAEARRIVVGWCVKHNLRPRWIRLWVLYHLEDHPDWLEPQCPLRLHDHHAVQDGSGDVIYYSNDPHPEEWSYGIEPETWKIEFNDDGWDPFREPWKAAEKRLRAAFEAYLLKYQLDVKEFMEASGFEPVVRKKTLLRDMRWLVQRQVLGHSLEAIAQAYMDADPLGRRELTADAVKKAIEGAATLVGLER